MGGHRARARRGRAAAHPAQGRHPRARQALRARARPLLPLPDVRSPAERPGARVPPARAAPRARGGRVGRRRAAGARADARRRHPPARSRAHPRLGRGRRLTSRSPTRVRSTRCRRSTCGRTDYAEKRLAWKRRHPLHVLLLRTYRIPRPVTVKVRDEYGGCRSWLEINRDLPFEGTPVLSDDEFDRAAEEIARHRRRPRRSRLRLSHRLLRRRRRVGARRRHRRRRRCRRRARRRPTSPRAGTAASWAVSPGSAGRSTRCPARAASTR